MTYYTDAVEELENKLISCSSCSFGARNQLKIVFLQSFPIYMYMQVCVCVYVYT